MVSALGAKQRIKNTVYRTVGEVGVRVPRATRPSLSVLLYHKINDLADNPGSVPVSLFRQHIESLDPLGYQPVGLGDVLRYVGAGAPLPRKPVLITFDDGYADNLLNAAPILHRLGYPSVLFVPVGCIGIDRRLPHDQGLVAANPLLDWDGVDVAEGLGMRVESHGIDHVPLASLTDGEARRQLAVSKQALEERLGRRIDAYAYVKGSRSDFAARHVSMVREIGYRFAFTTLTGSNVAGAADLLQLRRYNIEPYPVRTLELVLAGACDALAVKDTRAGSTAKGLFNRLLGTDSK